MAAHEAPAAALLLAAVACGDDSGSSEKITVTAGFYPLAYVAEQVGGPSVRVANLASPGIEPHDLELTPQQAQSIEDADLTLYIKGFQPAVDDAVKTDKAFDLATVQPLDGDDPHVWLDPARFAEIATAVGERLAAIDSGNARGYRERAAVLAAKLRALDGTFKGGLAGCERTEIIVSHDAFGYLAKRYGLKQIGIAGLDPETDPSPARIAEVSRIAREKKATTIFFEPLVPPDVAATVAQEAGVTTAVLDPVEGLATGSTDDYFTIMPRNLETLRTALSC